MKVAPVPKRFDAFAFVIACDSGRQQVPERLKVAWRKLRQIYDQTHRRGQNRLYFGMEYTMDNWEIDKHRRWKCLRSKALIAGREEVGSPISRFLFGPKPTNEWRELIDDLMGSLQVLSRDEFALLVYLLSLHDIRSGNCTLKSWPFGNPDTMLLSSVIDSL